MGRPKIVILEGHRLTGKSTIAKILRNKVNYATLINPTGFPDKGKAGLDKISRYYVNWFAFLSGFQNDDITFMFDRFMFSEVVYSRLYKDYDFQNYFDTILQLMVQKADVELIFIELDNDKELRNRAKRDKVLFADVSEDLEELAKQRDGYRQLEKELRDMDLPNLNITKIQVGESSSADIANIIIEDIIK
jgi:thymidylate kinase